jgi:PKHD-type hydroxylase
MLELRKILSDEALARLREIARAARWNDGRATAGNRIANIKSNEQMAFDDPLMPEVDRIVEAALQKHEAFKLFAYPAHVHGLLMARYRPGNTYGLHVDAALMGQGVVRRTDLSITMFLNTPDDYDGGELELHGRTGTSRSKLPAGDALCYHTGDLHQVLPVSAGERLVIVAWIQSHIRENEVREMLWDLAQVREALFQREGKTPLFDLINKTHTNLLRRNALT